MRSIHPQNIITIALIILEICIRQNLSMKKKNQRAITKRLSKQELQFMSTALPFDEMYPPTKFHNHSNYSFGDVHRTKVKFESKQRAINKKKKQTRVMVHVHCTPPWWDLSTHKISLHSPLMRSIHPQNIITIAFIILEICIRQNLSVKKNKGQ